MQQQRHDGHCVPAPARRAPRAPPSPRASRADRASSSSSSPVINPTTPIAAPTLSSRPPTTVLSQMQPPRTLPEMTRTAPLDAARPRQTFTSQPPAKPLRALDSYAQPFCDFLSNNPTVFHAVDAFARELNTLGFARLSERDPWALKRGGKYYVTRNNSSLIAFSVGPSFDPATASTRSGVAMIAGHVDAVTTRLKPVSKVDGSAGYTQLGVAPYAGGLNSTWWDRDLGIAGRVLVRDAASGKVSTRLVDLHYPIARVPTLAPHFGRVASGPFNKETQMVPIIGLDDTPGSFSTPTDPHTFAASQPPRLVRAVAHQLKLDDPSAILSWDLELYDVQPATLGGLDKEFIYGGRIDDKLCSWAAFEALASTEASASPSTVKVVGLFDDEEIGSLLRQGARGNFLPSTVERIVDAFAPAGANVRAQTFANSFLVSADVTHAVNPNFLNAYLHNHAPRLNTGMVVSADASGHMTTDAASTAFLRRVADKCGAKLQLFQVRNDTSEGGTVGPMLSSAMGVRAIDVGLPQLSMHSIRATTGSLDPGLGVQLFKGFFDGYEDVDGEFRGDE